MAGVPTAPDADDFRALARSSPWRWRSVRFTTHAVGPGSREPVRAWIERPSRIRVERLTGRVLLDEVQDVGPSTRFVVAYREADLEEDPRLAEPAYRAAMTTDLRRESEAWERAEAARLLAETVIDDAGLVRRRLTDRFAHDAPMYQNYHWVAMLDPLELADGQHEPEDGEEFAEPVDDGAVPGTTIEKVRVVEHEGRPAWEAVLRTTAAYDPRCLCCPLLPGEVADLYKGRRSRDGAYADAYRVRLDAAPGSACSPRRSVASVRATGTAFGSSRWWPTNRSEVSKRGRAARFTM